MDASGRIHKVVSEARDAIRASLLVEGLLAVVGAAAAGIVALSALDNLFALPAGWRIALVVTYVLALSLTCWIKLVRPLLAPWGEDRVAVRIERSVPGLDDGLINAVQLSREPVEGVEAVLTEALLEDVARDSFRIRPSRVVDWRSLRRIGFVAGAAVVAVVIYAVALPEYLGNAVARFSSPGTFIPPVSSIRLDVDPGEATVVRGEDLLVSATAEGGIPSSVRIRTDDGREAEMLFDGGAFQYRFEGVTKDFRYRVLADDAATRDFPVTVVERPRIDALILTYRYPEYTGLPERVEAPAPGAIRAVVGTRVDVEAVLNKPVEEAAIVLGRGEKIDASVGESRLRATLVVQRDDTWRIEMRDRDRRGNRDPARHEIVAVPDLPPTVRITMPTRDLDAVPGETIDIAVRGKDDFGLADLKLLLRSPSVGERVVREWTAEGPGVWDRTIAHRLILDEETAREGDELVLVAVVRDRKPGSPGTARSRELRIRVRGRADRVREIAAQTADVLAALRELIAMQRRTRGDTVALRDDLRTGREKSPASRIDGLTLAQTAVGTAAVRLAGRVPGRPASLARIRVALLGLAADEIALAVRHIDESRIRPERLGVVGDLDAATKVQDEILAALRALLEETEAIARRLEEEPDELLADEDDPDEPDLEDALRKAVEALKEFRKKQREILERTQEFESRPVDDWTEEERRKLEELAAQESELAKFLEDLKDDLSKIAEQDFSNSSSLEELVEVWAEVEKAAAALQDKNIELAVPLEQSGLEMAEELTTNLEKWLPDTKDTVKWNMEDLPEDLDTPMAELPEELEDLVGELLDEEDDLAEDVEDLTSRWTDSLDKGAGWGTEDGPISNNSAQGKTGNRSPNSSEIAGRSGEGRSGRSHGEMVEKEATGKGGRRTPTRLTPDPWEPNSVKDSSQDPMGGATGGGKLSGTGGEGLRGPRSPDVKGDLGRLRGRQVEIRQKAEKLERASAGLGLPTDGLERSIRIMKELEGLLGRGDLEGFAKRKGVLVDSMKDGTQEMLRHARLRRDRSAGVPEELRRELSTVDLDEVPEAYRDLIRQYYRILGGGGGESR
jgi:Sec-independent protein translocase protein TatA